MNTVEDTRRARLRILVEQHGSMANLCEKIGLARNDTVALTRVLNANVRHDRDGKTYNMGSPMAREIEGKLKLEKGWMDTPPTYAEIHGEDNAMSKAILLLEQMPEEQLIVATRLLTAIAQPEAPPKQRHGG